MHRDNHEPKYALSALFNLANKLAKVRYPAGANAAQLADILRQAIGDER